MRTVAVGAYVTILFGTDVYQGRLIFKQPATLPTVNPPWPWPDVALVDIEHGVGTAVTFDARLPERGTVLRVFGFPSNGESGGEEASVIYEGQQYTDRISDDARFILGQAQIGQGMSGGPLYAPGEVPVVYGLITATNHPSREQGGLVLPSLHIERVLASSVDLDIKLNMQNKLRLTLQPVASAEILDDLNEISHVDVPSIKGRAQAKTAGVSESREVLALLESADRARRRPNLRGALALASEAANHPLFSRLPASLRARTKRAIAMALVGRHEELERAKQLSEEAAALDADLVAMARLEAMIARVESGPLAALAVLPADLSPEIDALRAGYLIDDGQIRQADTLLANMPSSESEKPRMRCLRLFVAIFLKRRTDALRLAEGLVVAAQDDGGIAFGILHAFVLGSVPVQFWPAHLIGWPQPVPLSALVADPEQPARLRAAVHLADALLLNNDVQKEEQSPIEMWRFAAIAFDETRLVEAAVLAREMLSREPPNFRVFFWAWTMSLPVDVGPALGLVRQRAEESVATGEEVLALAWAPLHDGDGVAAEEILRRYEPMITDPILRSKWLLCLVQAMVLQNKLSLAAAFVNDISVFEDRQAAERLLIQSGEDPRVAMQRLTERWSTSGDAVSLLVAADIAHGQRDWNFLADHGRDIVAAFGNATAVRFAMYGAFNVQRYVEAIDRYAEFAVTGSDIPIDIIRLRAITLERMGDPQATSAFQALLDVAPTDANFYTAGYARFRRGDNAGVVSLAQRLQGLDDVTAATVLSYATWIRTTNPGLARALWRRAMNLGVPTDDLVLLAFDLALQLGIGDETGALQEPMARLAVAGEGGIRLVNQRDVIESVRAAAQQSADLFGQYRRAQLPIHLVCANTNINLIRTHIEQPRRNSTISGRLWTSIFIRHGCRPAVESLITTSGLPMLDATTFLLAWDLGLLSELIHVYGVLRVSGDLGALLAMAHDRAARGRPQLPHLRRLLEAVVSNRIRTIDSSSKTIDELALALGAAICDWATPDNASEHQRAGVPWCSPRRLIDSLLSDGSLGGDAHASAVRALGNIQNDCGDDLPGGSPLVLRYNVAGTLEECGILTAIASRRPVYVEERYVEQVRAELQAAEADTRLAIAVSEVIEQLRNGLDSGTIMYVERATAASGDMEDSLDNRAVLSLFAPLPDTAFIVVDDRYMNASPRRDDGIPIVSLWDVLRQLHEANELDPIRYYALVIQMRRRGLMYIPVESAEITYHLLRARIENDTITISEEMRVLERYVAAALLDTEALYATTGADEGPGKSQAQFLISLSASIHEAMRLLLLDGSPAAQWRASWIRDHLGVDGLPGFGVAGLNRYVAAQGTVDVELANFIADYLRS